MKIAFKKKYMIVYERPEHDEFVVYNMRKPWEHGHTHIHTYKQASYLVDLELQKKIPKRVNKYMIISLMRITKDDKYQRALELKLGEIQNAKPGYRNTPYFNKQK